MIESILEYGAAARACSGESRCGDLHTVIACPDGVLIAVVDGLGHGPEAATAAAIASSVVEAHASKSVVELLERCHQALRPTRGAVMSLAKFDVLSGSIAWIGVGNVECVLLHGSGQARREHTLLLRNGVVGGPRLPRLAAEVLRVFPGDVVVFATDGIDGRFRRALSQDIAPQHAADTILARHAKTDDDALVLVARYTGSGTARRKRKAARAPGGC
jgi:phosphoserine phosphatase RsbX